VHIYSTAENPYAINTFSLPYIRESVGALVGVIGTADCSSRVTTLSGQSWNLVRFSRPGKSWKTVKVMESHGK